MEIQAHQSFAGPAAMRDTADADEAAGPRFRDMLAALNPLQGLPVIGTIYRHVTGDVPHPAAQVVSGLLFGGPIGLMLGALSATFEQATGKTPVQMAMDAISPGRPDPGPTTLADALMPADPEPAPAPPPSLVAAQAPLQNQAFALAGRAAPPTPARPARMPEPQPQSQAQPAQTQPAQAAEPTARPRIAGARDLAFYQAHAGGRLPPAGATGPAPVQIAGLAPPRLLPQAPAPVREDSPTTTRAAQPASPPPVGTVPAPVAPAAMAMPSDGEQAGGTQTGSPRAPQDFSARMLEGLERYRAMSRGAEARGRTVTVSP